MGDLNTQAQSEEYDTMKKILTDNGKDHLEDILQRKYGRNPGTFGSYTAIDYIIRFTPKHAMGKGDKGTEKDHLKVLVDTATVEKFAVKGLPFSHLSDHYGVTVSLEYLGKSDSKSL